MTSTSSLRSVAETARWVAMYRALESERPDAHFQDPFARRLAGPRGEEIHRTLPRPMHNAAWSVIARTVLIDRFMERVIPQGVTLVLNLAAGLDSRPYRLALPAGLRWVEVDTPDLLAEKASLLAGSEPRCRLERVGLDLSDPVKRREFLRDQPGPGDEVLVLTEGLLVYLGPDDVAGLARDLAAIPACRTWITDLISPGLLAMINRQWGATLRGGTPLMRFAPPEGPSFFEQFGWRVGDLRPLLGEARRLRRLPWFLHLLAHLPGVDRYRAHRPWSAVCLLTRADGSGAPA